MFFKLVWLICLTGFVAASAYADQSDLKVGSSYRLEKAISIKSVKDKCNENTAEKKFSFAGKKSKFTVVKKFDGCDIVQFYSIFDHKDNADPLVKDYKEYVLPNKVHTVEIESSVTKSGRTSGLLVLPYKLRDDDKSLSGEATVGPYVGVDTRIGTYFIAAGLTQVSIPESDTETETTSALTLAGGWLFNNWAGIDFGLVAGWDHIGGDTGDNWQYEDDLWLSVMIGWNFSREVE